MVDPKRFNSLFAADRKVCLDTVPAARLLPSFGVDKAVRNLHLLYRIGVFTLRAGLYSLLISNLIQLEKSPVGLGRPPCSTFAAV